MYNNEILKKIVEEFGTLQAYLFCRMEARKMELLCQNSGSLDDMYDFYWWNNAYTELNEKLKNIEYENA